MHKTLVSVTWLNVHVDDPDLIILDASQSSNNSEANSIPSARVFDLKNNFSDKSSDFPNTFPTIEQFELESKKLGINKNSKIVVYDNRGIYFSPRVWWMFKVMGHENIAVLDGGLPNWLSQGFKTELRQHTKYEIGDFNAKLDANAVKDFDFINENIEKQDSLVVDARSAGRFNGIAPEPRKGLRSGNIPNSINIPYETLLNNGKFKSNPELLEIFNSTRIANEPLVFSCGSGVTACIVLLAAELIDKSNKKSVYDGSWTEWALKTEGV